MHTLFVLEDDADILYIIEKWFSKHQFAVFPFSNSIDFFKAIENITPDIILIDVLLSESKNGKTVCHDLKERYHFTNKVLLLSATAVSAEDIAKCGADGFIEKPFDLQEILNTVTNALF